MSKQPQSVKNIIYWNNKVKELLSATVVMDVPKLLAEIHVYHIKINNEMENYEDELTVYFNLNPYVYHEITEQAQMNDSVIHMLEFTMIGYPLNLN